MPHDDDDNDNKISNEELTEEDKTIAGDLDDDHTSSSAQNDDDEDNLSVAHDDDDDDSSTATSTANQPVNQTLVTKEGLKNLQDELNDLENVKRREVAGRLKEAISYGDLSENSEYEDAKNEQAFVEGRIAELTEMIKNAKIITEKSGGKGKTVKVGSTVKIQNLTEKDEPETYTIVGATEANPMENKISNESPIGIAIIDREQGDEVEVDAPAGKFKYKIIKVS
jgi:transcription elongation factor GreA